MKEHFSSYYFLISINSHILSSDLEKAKHDPKARLKKMNHETKEALAELEKTYKPTEHDIVPGLREIQKKGKDKPDSINAASYSSGNIIF